MPDVLGTPGGTSPNQVGQFYVPPSEWNPAPLDEDLSGPVVFNAALKVSLFLAVGFLAPWAGSDEQVITPIAYEEDSWIPPVLINNSTVSIVTGGVNQSTPEPTVVDEEPAYNRPITWPPQVIRLAWGGDDEPAVITSTDGDEWQPKLPQSNTLGKLTLWAQDEALPPLAVANDEPWLNLNRISSPWIANLSLDSNGDWVPLVSVSAEEDFWQPIPPVTATALSLLVGTSAKVEAISASVIDDADPYPTVIQDPPLVSLIAPWEFGTNDDIGGRPSDDYWQNPVPPVRLTYDARFVVRDSGESVPGARATEEEAFRPAILSPQIYRSLKHWNFDQLETFVFLRVEDEQWVAKRIIWPPSVIVTPWRAGENEDNAQAFGLDDERWGPLVPPQATLIGQRVWFGEQGDSALTPATIIDEEQWLKWNIVVGALAPLNPWAFEQHEIFTPVIPPPPEPKCATEIVTLGAFTIEGPSTVAITLEISLAITPSVESPTDPCL